MTSYVNLDATLSLSINNSSGQQFSNTRSYLTRSEFVTAVANGDLTTLAVGSIISAEGLEYIKSSTSLINDLPNWIPSGQANLRHFGGVINTDSTAAIQNAVDSKLSILVVGNYYATNRIVTTGTLLLYGVSRKTSTIRWIPQATDTGIKTTLNNWNFEVVVENLSLLTDKAGEGTAIHVDFTPALQAFLGGTGTIDFFNVQCRIFGNRMAGTVNTALQGWKKGIELNCPFCVHIKDNDIVGKASGVAKLPADFITDSVGVHIPDQAIRTLANVVVENNRIFNFNEGVLSHNVEGFTFTKNDIQVCYNGFTEINTIIKVNQYRIFGNHIGTTGTQIKISNARQALIEHNEISYRAGRTDGGSVSLIVLDSVYSANVVGNSIRGNVFNDTDVIVDGIEFRWDNNLGSTDYTRYISVEGNSFQNLRHCMVNSAGDNLRYLNHTNNSFEKRGKFLESATQAGNLTQSQLRGNGKFDQIDVAALNPALYVEQYGSAALAINRVGGGGAVTFYNGTSLVGSISTTGSATAYNTTSDQTLKNDTGIFDPVIAKQILSLIQIHGFTWKSSGEADIGVFAQELYQVYPTAVAKGGWYKLDDSGNTIETIAIEEGAYYIPWSVDYSKLIPIILVVLADLI